MTAFEPTHQSLLAHGDFLRAIARGLLGDEHRAEDAVQSAYVRALAHPPRRDGVRAWLGTVVRRLAHNDRRADHRRATRERATATAPLAPSTEEIVAREELRRLVVDAVLALDEPYRATVVLRYFEALPTEEIAARLGVGTSTVRTRMQRAHALLRQRLDRHHGNRQAWSAVLLPLSGGVRPHTTTSLATSSTLTHVLVMNKVMLCMLSAAAAAIVWLAWPSAGTPQGTPAVEEGAARAPITAVGDEQAKPPAADSRQVVAAAPVADPAAGATTTGHPESWAPALTSYSGRVVHHDGSPVADCAVELLRIAEDALLRAGARNAAPPRLTAGAARTAPDGRFTIEGVRPHGTVALRLGAGTGLAAMRWVRQTPTPGQHIDVGDVLVGDGAVLTGTLQDTDGTPIAGAVVIAADVPPPLLDLAPLHRFSAGSAMVLQLPGAPVSVVELAPWVHSVLAELPVPRARTDASGGFRLVGVPPGRVVLAAHATGHEPLVRAQVEASPGGRHDLGAITLSTGHTCGGTVRDTGGEPVEGAEVVVASAAGFTPFSTAAAPVRTNADGQFAAHGLAAGRVAVAARRGPGEPWTVAPAAPVDAAHTITLPAQYRLTLVLNADGGAPPADVDITLLPGQGPGLPDLWTHQLVSPLDLRGRRERRDREITIRDLPAGSYTVRVDATGHAPATAAVTLDGDQRLPLRLVPPAPLRVRVVDAAGAPVADAEIHATPRGEGAWRGGLPLRCGTTGEDGAIALDALAGDRALVLARHPAYGTARAEVRRGEAAATIAFATPGAIRGQLVLPPEARDEQWSVLLTPPRMGPLPAMPLLATPDADGRFEFAHLQPGRYECRATSAFGGAVSPGWLHGIGRFAWLPDPTAVPVAVRAATTASAEIHLQPPPEPTAGPTGRVRGTLHLDGAPLAEAVVMCERGEEAPLNAVTDEHGQFSIDGVPAGTHFLFAFEIDQRSFADNWPHQLIGHYVAVSANDTATVALEVTTGSLSGAVHRADGAAAASAWVEIRGTLDTARRGEDRDQPVESRYVVQTEADGSFAVDRVPPGTWTIRGRAGLRDGASGSLAPVELRGGQRLTDLRLTLDG